MSSGCHEARTRTAFPHEDRGGIGVRALVVFYISSLVGTGILLVPGLTAERAGPASLLAWILLAAASYPFARFFAEMSAWRPHDSGLAVIVEAGFGPRAGRTAVLLLLVTYTVGNPVMGVVSARYLLHLLGIPDGPVFLLAAGFMLLSVGFALLGIRVGARLQAAALLLLLAGLGTAVLLAVPSMNASEYSPFAPHGWAAVGGAVVMAFFSFLGWENVSSMAEQVKDPARTYRRAIRWAVPLVGFLYIGVAAAYLAVPGDAPVVISVLLYASSGPAGAVAGDLLALGLAVVATNAWVVGAARLAASAARSGIVPRRLHSAGKLRGGTSAGVLALLAASYTGVLVGFAVTGVGEALMLTLTGSSFLLLYVVAAVGALRAPEAPAGLRTCAAVTALLAACFLPLGGTGSLTAVLLAGCCAVVTALSSQDSRDPILTER